MNQAKRWYDRANWPYEQDRAVVRHYGQWLSQVPWQCFATFTFAWTVSQYQAGDYFRRFINMLEHYYRCDICYVRGDEKRFSGCGKPGCPFHYHSLLASAATLNAATVEDLWMSLAGHRSDNNGAKVDPYDPDKNGASYVLKLINAPDAS